MKSKYLTPSAQTLDMSHEDILTTSPTTSINDIFYEGDDRDIADRVTW